MTEKYARPPIFDCVIEVRLSAPMDESSFAKVRKSAAARYAQADDEIEFQFTLQPGAHQSVTGKPVGGRYVSADAADILIVRKNALVVARGAPYPGWTSFKTRALDELRRWVKSIGERQEFERLGVRYQNRLDIPLTGEGTFSPDPYLTVLPNRPPVLAGKANAFSAHIGGCPVGDYMVNLNVGMMASPLIDHVGLLVDIDAYCESISSYADLIDKIEGVRAVKNLVFESVITDAARSTFGE